MRKAAVLGFPINHSLSPAIHNAAYRNLGFKGSYSAHEVRAEELKPFLAEQISNPEWIGFSLTMPLKEEICRIAKDVDIEVDQRSLRISSANTLHRVGNTWRATSTDVTGFQYLFSQRELGEIALLGAGGTARAAIEALPNDTKEVVVYRRSQERDDALRNAFPERKLQFQNWQDIESAWMFTTVINTVPMSACIEAARSFRSPTLLIDSLYSPWLPPFSQRQSEESGDLITGVDLLCAQALDQIRFMTGENFDNDEMFHFLKEEALKHVK